MLEEPDLATFIHPSLFPTKTITQNITDWTNHQKYDSQQSVHLTISVEFQIIQIISLIYSELNAQVNCIFFFKISSYSSSVNNQYSCRNNSKYRKEMPNSLCQKQYMMNPFVFIIQHLLLIFIEFPPTAKFNPQCVALQGR